MSCLMASGILLAGAQTQQRLVIETTDGTKTYFDPSEVTGVLFENAPEYTIAANLLQATYSTSGDNGVYSFEVSDCPGDEVGYPSEIGGVLGSVTLVGPLSEDRYEATIPAGYYRVGPSTEQYTIDISRSLVYVRMEAGPDGVAPVMVIGGTADVRHTAGGYDIRLELQAMSGETYNLRYEGPITFNLAPSDYETLTEDQDITFTGGQGRFYSNWNLPFSCDMLMQFYAGEFDSSDNMIEGFWLNLPVYMPKVEDEMNPVQKLADGTYKAEYRNEVYNFTNMPYTFERGALIDFLGSPVYTGTYLTVTNKDGRRYIALVTEGTFTVSGGGTKVEFDMTTDQGVKIKGSYDGNPTIVNFCDNDERAPKRPYSLLTEDVTLNFPADATGVLFQEQESYVENLVTSQLMITEPSMTRDDFVMLTFFSSSEGLANGTYTVTSEIGDHCVTQGTIDGGGQMFLSWYGDLSKVDEEGYNTWIAPIMGGTITVEDGTESGTKLITFDVVDDNGHAITGSWTGEVHLFLPDENAQLPKNVRVR